MRRAQDRPNGLCFSPDESLMYIADSGASHTQNADGEWEDTYTGPKRHVRVFDVVDGKALRGGRIFCEVDPANGVPDGIRTDTKGNLCATNPPSACLLIAPRLTGPACYADG